MNSHMTDDRPALRPTPRVPALQTVSFATLGCKTNQFESAAMQETLQGAGYRIVPFEVGAELVVVNTCTVTGATDAQSRNLIRRARRLNPSCRVVVTGCYAQVEPQAMASIPGVSLVIGNEEKRQLLKLLTATEGGSAGRVAVSDIRASAGVCLPPLTSFAGRSRAFLQIQNGCDAFCSYCIIPYARGASRSAEADEIVEQVAGLVAAGFPEVVLTGIHIGGYGADLAPQVTLNNLVRRICDETELHRLRLGSIEPTELSDELLETIATVPALCEHLHIPLQAGDDLILKRMGRSYDTDFSSRLVARARQLLPDAAICLDLITGFPGESDEQFERGRRFIESLDISDLHVFPYSPRPGTPAASFAEQVPGDISRARAARLRELANNKQRQFAERFIGQELEVVVETARHEGLCKGVTRNYLDVRFAADDECAGRCVCVRPLGWRGGFLEAERVTVEKLTGL
jgi:threonylcarbamoyladenosine tRNA methylthiotransferase MtaB